MDWGDVATWVGGIAGIAGIAGAVAATVAVGQAVRGWVQERRSRRASRRLPWDILSGFGTRFMLVNRSGQDAFDVSIEGTRVLVTGPTRRQWETIPAGEFEVFHAYEADQADDAVTVRWAWKQDGKRQQYRLALPVL